MRLEKEFISPGGTESEYSSPKIKSGLEKSFGSSTKEILDNLSASSEEDLPSKEIVKSELIKSLVKLSEDDLIEIQTQLHNKLYDLTCGLWINKVVDSEKSKKKSKKKNKKNNVNESSDFILPDTNETKQLKMKLYCVVAALQRI